MLNILGLKSRNLITVPLDIPNVTVLSVHQNERRDVVITVASTLVRTLCQYWASGPISGCSRSVTNALVVPARPQHKRWPGTSPRVPTPTPTTIT